MDFFKENTEMRRIHKFFADHIFLPDSSWQLCLGIGMGFLLLALLFSQGQIQKQREALAGRLAPSVLRFHILADSDRKEDQQVKLEIRSLILDYLEKHLPPDTDKKKTIDCLMENREEIVTAANAYLKEHGFDYQASLQLTNCYFPSRIYGPYVFPCGYYDAARITLGRGGGHNWWCILYPRFCFVDAACQTIPEESQKKLHQELKQDDYLALKDNRPEIEIRFWLLPSFGSHTVSR